MKSIKEALRDNRDENRDEHKVINSKLDDIAKEVRKYVLQDRREKGENGGEKESE